MIKVTNGCEVGYDDCRPAAASCPNCGDELSLTWTCDDMAYGRFYFEAHCCDLYFVVKPVLGMARVYTEEDLKC